MPFTTEEIIMPFTTIEEIKEALEELGGGIPCDSRYKDIEGMIIDEKIETGGAQGGDCWGNNPSGYSTGKSFGESSILDMFLEEHYPDVSFLRYRKIRRKVISTRDTSHYDYYGNYTEYSMRMIDLAELLEALRELEE